MGRINTTRVLLGGLVAGLIVNISEFVLNTFVIAQDWVEVMKSLNRSPEMTSTAIIAFNVWGFIMGLVGVWLYAAIRPRFGAGPMTALRAGCVMFVVGYLLSMVPPVVMGMFPVKLIGTSLVWGFVEVHLAVLAGAKFYTE